MTAVFPNVGGTFVPNLAATGGLQVEFSRNPQAFAINLYAKLIPVSQTQGYYLEIDRETAARIQHIDMFRWADGADAPQGQAFKHEFKTYRTERYANPFSIGTRSVRQADFDVVMSHTRQVAHRAMLLRTASAASVLTTGANWGGNTDTATNLGGGEWVGSTAAQGYIKKTFNEVTSEIIAQTNGAVGAGDLMCVVDMEGAKTIVESPEYQQYLVNHGSALAAAAYDTTIFREFGLLPVLYGVQMVVERATRITSNEGATTVRTGPFSGIATDQTVAVFLSRTKGQEGVEGVPDFSTLTNFVYEDFSVEQMEDPNNRRITGRVVDDFEFKLTAPASGFYVTQIDTPV